MALAFLGLQGAVASRHLQQRRNGKCARRTSVMSSSMDPSKGPKKDTILVVAELESLNSPSEALTTFFDRVETHRDANLECYVTLSSLRDFDAAVKYIVEVQVPRGINCVITRGGMDIYQAGFSEPDPYYSQLSLQGWDESPTLWTMSEFFSDDLELQEDAGAALCAFGLREGSKRDLTELQTAVGAKMQEMGLKTKVVINQDAGQLALCPPNASLRDAVTFMQKIMRVAEERTIVFVSATGPAAGDFLAKDPVCLLIVSNASETSSENGIFKTEKSGAEALMDGIMHHAIL